MNLPADRSLESGVLSLAMNFPECRLQARSMIPDSEAFYEADLRELWEVICEMDDAGDMIDAITALAHIRSTGRENKVLAKCVIEADWFHQHGATSEEIPLPDRMGEYLRRLIECFLKRCLITDAMRTTQDMPSEVAEAITSARDSLDRIERMAPGQTDDAGNALEQVLGEMTGQIPVELPARTGIREIDRMMGGLRKGAMMVIAGGTGGGKTALALEIINRVGMIDNLPCWVVSYELPEEDVLRRLIAYHGGLPLEIAFAQRKPEMHELPKIERAAKAVNNAEIEIIDDPGLSIHHIRTKAKVAKAQGKAPRVIVLDYLQLIPAAKADTRELEVASIGRAAKQLARELDATVIALSQLNDQGKLRESRALGQDADAVAIIDSETAEVVLDKNRNGPTGKINGFAFQNGKWTESERDF